MYIFSSNSLFGQCMGPCSVTVVLTSVICPTNTIVSCSVDVKFIIPIFVIKFSEYVA